MLQSRSGAGAMAVELAGALLLAVALSDALGLAAASFYLLVVAVPVTAAAGLVCLGRVVDASTRGRGDGLGRLQAGLSTLLVLAIVVGAAARAPIVPEDDVPGFASGALAVAFGVLILQALVALSPAGRERAQDERPDGALLPFDGELAEVLEHGVVAERRARRARDHHLAGPGLRLQAGAGVDHVSGR
jgi:hypothetical protein